MHPARRQLIEEHFSALLRVILSLFALGGLKVVEPSEQAPVFLPRAVWRRILGLLRPAEAVARRLIYLIALETAINPRAAAMRKGAGPTPNKSGVSGFKLFDPQWRTMPPSVRRIPGTGPRISFFDECAALGREVRAKPSTIDAARIVGRLRALHRAITDPARQAKRLAKWLRKPLIVRKRRSPLRVGDPPGLGREPQHPIHDLLRECHALAVIAS